MAPVNKTPGTLLIALWVILVILFIGFITLIARALLKYIRSGNVRKEKSVIMKSIGKVLKEYRNKCRMTQESVGVSR